MAYAVYYQGARFSVKDFDPYKTITYFSKLYEKPIPEELKAKLKDGRLSRDECVFISRTLDLDKACTTAEEICEKLLNPFELADLFVSDDEPKIGSDTVFAVSVSQFRGEFYYYDEDKLPEEVSNCMMLSFHVPFVWDIRDAKIPADKRVAIFQLQQVSKGFLKDGIEWEKKIRQFMRNHRRIKQ